MRIHHLNCGTFAPYGGRLISQAHKGFGAVEMVSHCLLIETGAGLVLVDTGLGHHDVTHPSRTLHWPFRPALRPRLAVAETALSQIVALGYRPSDVRDIVLTHLDVDHAGGLRDFPDARVHLSATELAAAQCPTGVVGRRRYVRDQFAHKPKWVEHQTGGETWFGFDAVRDLDGLPSSILLVPLPGHTLGHCGIAIDTGQHGSARWLLHAGDSYFSHTQVDRRGDSCPPLLSAIQIALQTDRDTRRRNVARLAELASDPEVDVICAHDPEGLVRSRARSQDWEAR